MSKKKKENNAPAARDGEEKLSERNKRKKRSVVILTVVLVIGILSMVCLQYSDVIGNFLVGLFFKAPEVELPEYTFFAIPLPPFYSPECKIKNRIAFLS